MWGGAGSSLNEHGDNLVTHTCPMGYCKCCFEHQEDIPACLFSADSRDLNSQCVNNRKGGLEYWELGPLQKLHAGFVFKYAYVFVHACVCFVMHV